jgi:hypothetical protein
MDEFLSSWTFIILMAASYVCVPVAFVAAAVFAVLFLLKRTRNDPSDGGRRGRPPER